ncbi:hypothetical protein BOX15_Mlig029982g2 [Macrostomum lignano]|uniref:Uncharacterized protein n=2 Tax=Macrostomum lignano TaxID=282301 RepID=A0A267E3A0_9PLAT|nr:hypothetical protein BOX15_Mlig029982g2 [Macrostomum lignano]
MSSSAPANFKDALRRHLDSSSNRLPNEIIESWQAENSIRLPSLDAALPLLDRVKVRRYDFYQATAELLRDRLLTRIRELAATGRRSSYKRMAELLEASFPYLSVPTLRPVPMTLLEHLTTLLEMHKPAVRPRLKDKYLKAIASSAELYSASPVAVKRLIWEGDPKLFVSEISPLLDEFVRSRAVTGLCLADIDQPVLTVPSKTRRQLPVIQHLLQLIGTSSFLYEQTVACLREKYKCTGALEACTLRMDLLMSLHDAKIDDVCVRDPLHKFAWVLDACGRDRVSEIRRLTELRSFYKAAKSAVKSAAAAAAADGDDNQVGAAQLGEVSLLCACPHIQATLALCLLSRLDQLVLAAQLPRTDSICRFLVRLLQLGLSAWELVRQDDQHQQQLGWLSESVAACELLPSVARLRLETQLRLVGRQTRRLLPAAPAQTPSAAQQQPKPTEPEKKTSGRKQQKSNSKSKKQQTQKEQQQPSILSPPPDEALRPPALPLVCAGSRVGRLLARYHCVHVVRELRRTATDMLQVSCDLLLDLIDALAPLDEEFEPMALQYVAVQLCQLRESARPLDTKSAVAASPAVAAAAAASASAASVSGDDKLTPSVADASVPGSSANDEDDISVGGVSKDAESCRQLDRVIQRLCSRLLGPRAAKQPLPAALLARCARHLPAEEQPAAAAAPAGLTSPTTPSVGSGGRSTPFFNRARGGGGL